MVRGTSKPRFHLASDGHLTLSIKGFPHPTFGIAPRNTCAMASRASRDACSASGIGPRTPCCSRTALLGTLSQPRRRLDVLSEDFDPSGLRTAFSGPDSEAESNADPSSSRVVIAPVTGEHRSNADDLA